MASYASLVELKAYLDIASADVADDADLTRALNAATALIDGHTGRSFALETAATKYFTARDTRTVDVRDLITATGVAIDTAGDGTYATAVAAGAYTLEPFNEGRYQRLVLNWSTSGYFAPGRTVRIVGDWGFVEAGAAPAAVKQACLIQATRLYRRSESPFGIIQSPEFGTVARLPKIDPDVALLLERYVATTGATSQRWVLV